ncbi:MAG: DUF4249 domain-containing protein [Bacteroidota bacterium]
MKKRLLYILIPLFIACEKVIEVDLPPSQNLVVIEGWLSDVSSSQRVRITRSNAFSDRTPITTINSAEVIVQSRNGDILPYSYNSDDGYYYSDSTFSGQSGLEYRLRVIIDDSVELRSDWDEMPARVDIGDLEADSFQDNDPDNSNREITIFYPKITTLDPSESDNYYRWIFLKNNTIFTEPELITIQNDRLFNGNFIPNNFRNFNYSSGDEMTVQLASISRSTHDYLSLLKSQITTLGTSSGTTPAIVNGNLFNVNDSGQLVLGYFGTIAISENTINVR